MSVKWNAAMQKATGKQFPVRNPKHPHVGIICPAMGAYIKSQIK